MNLRSNAVLTLNPNFINLGIASFNTPDKLGFISVPTTTVGSPTSISEWIRHGHGIEEAATDRLSKMRENSNYILKSYFENMKKNQDFERENISLTNEKTSPNDDGEILKVGTNVEMMKFGENGEMVKVGTNGEMVKIRKIGEMVKVGTNGEMVKGGTKTPKPTPLTQPIDRGK